MNIKVRGFGPFLQIFDMPTSIRFYRDILGFEVRGTSSPENYFWAVLKLGPAGLILHAAYEDGKRPPAPDANRVAAHEDTTFYLYCDDLDDLYEYLQRRGVTVSPPKLTDGEWTLHVKDPDGYGLCFHHVAKRPS